MLYIIYSDLGAHIEGFIAVVAHTVCVGRELVTGRAADVMLAAHQASEAALRLLRPANEVNYKYVCRDPLILLQIAIKYYLLPKIRVI